MPYTTVNLDVMKHYYLTVHPHRGGTPKTVNIFSKMPESCSFTWKILSIQKTWDYYYACLIKGITRTMLNDAGSLNDIRRQQTLKHSAINKDDFQTVNTLLLIISWMLVLPMSMDRLHSILLFAYTVWKLFTFSSHMKALMLTYKIMNVIPQHPAARESPRISDLLISRDNSNANILNWKAHCLWGMPLKRIKFKMLRRSYQICRSLLLVAIMIDILHCIL